MFLPLGGEEEERDREGEEFSEVGFLKSNLLSGTTLNKFSFSKNSWALIGQLSRMGGRPSGGQTRYRIFPFCSSFCILRGGSSIAQVSEMKILCIISSFDQAASIPGVGFTNTFDI